MSNSETNALRKPYSRIYVEDAAKENPRTARILAKFPDAVVIPIRDYKHVFNRPHQPTQLQKEAPALILAVQKPPFLYTGPAVCQDFGETYFYYTSGVMNCPFLCDYCYLRGMYPSGDIVLFVNLEDTFREAETVLSEHPLYLCISYDTDLLALEGITGFFADWTAFAAAHPDLTIEVRTKSSPAGLLETVPALPNVIYAITLSPENVIARFERRTASLERRLQFAKAVIKSGCPLRLCFDPMLDVPDFEAVYGTFFDRVFSEISGDAVRDISVGTFRIAADYLKRMRKNHPCEITTYPYTLTDGVYGYDPKRLDRMLRFAKGKLCSYTDEKKLFFG